MSAIHESLLVLMVQGGLDAAVHDRPILRCYFAQCPDLAGWSKSKFVREKVKGQKLTTQLAWGFTLKGATKIQIINEAVGLMFTCSPEEIQSGACVAQSGEQL